MQFIEQLILAVGGLIAIPVTLVMSVPLALFGRELAIANLFLDVSAETTPPGSWSVHLVPLSAPERSVDTNALRLSHSCVYDDASVLGLITSWIRGGVLASAVDRSGVLTPSQSDGLAGAAL